MTPFFIACWCFLAPSWLDVLARLSIDAKIELIAAVEETLRLPPELRLPIHKSVKHIRELKDLRNSVVHARVFDATNGIGQTIRRGGKVREVLLVESALEFLYTRLIVLNGELVSAWQKTPIFQEVFPPDF